jgi:hypothetical protein
MSKDLLEEVVLPKAARCQCGRHAGHHTVEKRPVRAVISRAFEVPEIAGYSMDGLTLYIDRRLPDRMAGVPIDRFLEVHEEVEKALEDKLGFSYSHAHEIATAAEREAVELAGFSWTDYDKEMQIWIKKLEGTAKDLPEDLEEPNKIGGKAPVYTTYK